MTNENLTRSLIEKCEVFYGEELLTNEQLLTNYMRFISEGFTCGDKSVLFGLHTGALSFDVISILVAALGCIPLGMISNDEIIESFHDGDIVVYKNSRYKWRGVCCREENKLYYNLEQDAKGRDGKPNTFVSVKRKHLIKPYYGDSVRTDGTGLRKKNTNREDFLAFLFDVSKNEIPSIIDASIVIVCEKKHFSDLVKNIHIVYDGGKSVDLLDIVTASYYTSTGEEHQIGTNQLKAESVLKATSQISSARDLVLNKEINKPRGLVVIGASSQLSENTELADLLSRKTLKYINISGIVDSTLASFALDMIDKISLFACTKEYLKYIANSTKCVDNTPLIDELHRQVENIVYNTFCECSVDGGWDWKEYKEIRTSLQRIQGSTWNERERNEFLISAYTLINLLNTALFTMEEMESAIENDILSVTVCSPQKRIEKLWELSDNSGEFQDVCLTVVVGIENKYNERLTVSPKLNAIKNYIRDYFTEESRIVIIVPKAYYIDILRHSGRFNVGNRMIEITTVNKFNCKNYYDGVLVSGDLKHGKQFDPLMCNAAMEIVVFVYQSEQVTFGVKKDQYVQLNARINRAIGVVDTEKKGINNVDENSISREEKVKIENEVQSFEDIDKLIDDLQFFDASSVVPYIHRDDLSGQTAEVIAQAVFVSGENIYFSRYYKALFFEPDEDTIQEKNVKEIIPGDILVFARRDAYFNNIVDIVFDKLLSEGKFDSQTRDAVEKSYYWKEALREYKDKHNLTFRDVAEHLNKYGATIQEMAIRQWLAEDSHIIGPREEVTIKKIAQLTQNPYLLVNSSAYFEACRLVRKRRKEVLGILGEAIADKLRGTISNRKNLLGSVNDDNIDKLSMILEVEKVVMLPESITVPMSIVNKPVMRMEV